MKKFKKPKFVMRQVMSGFNFYEDDELMLEGDYQGYGVFKLIGRNDKDYGMFGKRDMVKRAKEILKTDKFIRE